MATSWDPRKNEANKARHGLAFEDFAGFDEAPVEIVDDRFDYGETRYRAFGRIDGRGHCLVYTVRDRGMHLISFRRAHEKEMKRYERD